MYSRYSVRKETWMGGEEKTNIIRPRKQQNMVIHTIYNTEHTAPKNAQTVNKTKRSWDTVINDDL